MLILDFYYLLVTLLVSLQATAFRLGGNDIHAIIAPSRAADPPPAPTPLPHSPDGTIVGNLVINYTPNNPSNHGHSCWTPPRSRPPPSDNFAKGTCSVCVVQRSNTDASADYLLWVRDNDNNAMGNMGATTIFPIDGMISGGNNQSIIPVGQSPLTIYSMLSMEDPNYRVIYLEWAVPGTPSTSFDAAPAARTGTDCNFAGTATNGAVVYFEWFIDC